MPLLLSLLLQGLREPEKGGLDDTPSNGLVSGTFAARDAPERLRFSCAFNCPRGLK